MSGEPSGILFEGDARAAEAAGGVASCPWPAGSAEAKAWMGAHATARAGRVARVLVGYRYRFGSEGELHCSIADMLRQEGIEFEHEAVAGPADRFDFLVQPGVVIEVKTRGSFSEALRQIGRYSLREDVLAVVLASSRSWAGNAALPTEIGGKPVLMVKLQGMGL